MLDCEDDELNLVHLLPVVVIFWLLLKGGKRRLTDSLILRMSYGVALVLYGDKTALV